MSEHVGSAKSFIAVWVALLIFTGITVGVSFIDLGPFNAVVALVIATIKALMVILVFMEVKDSTKLTKVIILSGFFWLMILLALSMSDYASRGWMQVPR